ncbi:MAG: FAD binding domain-containing protein [Candidatus Binatia bacterium]
MRGLLGFDFFRARSLQDAWQAVAGRPAAAFLAGGTDVLVKLKMGTIRSPLLVSLKGINELKGIVEVEDGIEIGALTTIDEIVHSPLIFDKCPLLHSAARHFGSNQVRNLATVGGNLCNASPAGDLSVALMCLNGEVKVDGPEGTARVALTQFFQGPGLTHLKARNIVTSIFIPGSKGDWSWRFLKLGRRNGMEIAIVNLALGIHRHEGICKEARIALGAVAPTPIRAQRAEQDMTGKRIDEKSIEQVACLAAQESKPISDVRASAEYRKEMVTNLTRRALSTL